MTGRRKKLVRDPGVPEVLGALQSTDRGPAHWVRDALRRLRARNYEKAVDIVTGQDDPRRPIRTGWARDCGWLAASTADASARWRCCVAAPVSRRSVHLQNLWFRAWQKLQRAHLEVHLAALQNRPPDPSKWEK